MCVNCHYVYNKYIHKRILVPCGKCHECLQDKADKRAQRIRYNVTGDTFCWFVTLSYDNNHVPFVNMADFIGHDLSNGINLPIYRGINSLTPIDSVYVDGFSPDFDWRKVARLRHHGKAIKQPYVGLCYYKDVQNFLKRLRINLIRNEIFTPISYFACQEYGETTSRPHGHLAIFCKSEFSEEVKRLIIKSWPYGDMHRLRRSIEPARHPSDYLASYVNSDANLSSFFRLHGIKAKHSMSMGFGTHLRSFSLLEILKSAERGLVTFDYRSKGSKGDVVTLPIPEYVINRYFPKFKGYSRVSPDTLANVLQRPALLPTVVNNGDFRKGEIEAIGTRIRNCFLRYQREKYRGTDLVASLDEYIIDYIRVRTALSSTCLKLWYKHQVNDPTIPKLEYYDNINELLAGHVHSDLKENYPKSELLKFCNYNNFMLRKKKNEKKSIKYDHRYKQRKDTNLIYAYYSDDF